MSGLLFTHLRGSLYLNDGRVVMFKRGDSVPSNLADGELRRLERIGAVGTELRDPRMSRVTDSPAGTPAPGPTIDLGKMTVSELSSLYAERPPTVKELIAAVGDNPSYARLVLDAEETVTKGEPRPSLVEKLEKVIGKTG